MKCKYEFYIGDSDRVGCRNTEAALGGIVPILFCGNCPWRETATSQQLSFFQQTQSLLLKRQSSGEYKPDPKPCGGCGEVKRRETEVLQFVFPYWHSGASDDEIRWSVRSVETNYRGKSKITVIGDRPPWYSGHYIPQQRVHKHTKNRPFRDMLAKVWTMATHQEVDREFVWMMDDIYFIKPVTFEELSTPRAVRWHECESNSWQKRKSSTMAALSQAGRTVHDYATHLPHVAEKDKLRQIYDEFNLHENTMLWEVLYGNTFRGQPQSPFPFFRRIQKKIGLEELKQITEQASVFNHTAAAWCPGIREFLAERFPNPSTCETEQEFTPKYKITQRVRPPVKRRPPETHRAVLERQQH